MLWYSIQRPLSATTHVFTGIDGATQRTTASNGTNGSSTAWAQATQLIGSINNDQLWNLTNGVGNVGALLLTGMEIYGTVAPYMLNDVVRYNGLYYKSTKDNNSDTPGVGLGWVQIT